MLETLIIADRDVDQAQATMLAVRNAGFDNPIFYFRSSAALIARLATPTQKAPRPSAILIDVNLLRECGPELMRCMRAAEPPIEIAALLGHERERVLVEQCGLPQIECVSRPVTPSDVRRLLGVQPKPKPAGHPRLLWPGRPDHLVRPSARPVSQHAS